MKPVPNGVVHTHRPWGLNGKKDAYQGETDNHTRNGRDNRHHSGTIAIVPACSCPIHRTLKVPSHTARRWRGVRSGIRKSNVGALYVVRGGMTIDISERSSQKGMVVMGANLEEAAIIASKLDLELIVRRIVHRSRNTHT